MSIKIDLGNQVRQLILPQWKPLLPLFEAVMNSFQAIKDANLPTTVRGRVDITVERSKLLFGEELAPIVGFKIEDNGVGLDDDNFDSFNTAFSRRKELLGGKGLGRLTWLKAFQEARIESIFLGDDGNALFRSFVFNEHYDPEQFPLPKEIDKKPTGTTVELWGLRQTYAEKFPKSTDVIIQKLIEHFILVLLEATCPLVVLNDLGAKYRINEIFDKTFKASSSRHNFALNGSDFTLHGFRLPTPPEQPSICAQLDWASHLATPCLGPKMRP